jgi:uncharacterized protein YigE (DUF2233 family)
MLAVIGLCAASGCIQPQPGQRGEAVPTALVITPPADAASVSAADQLFEDESMWRTVVPGMERRVYRPDPAAPFASFAVLRLDPDQFAFRVHYRPGEPYSTSAWSAALPQAAALINANYFDPQGMALGLLIANGVVYGQPYVGMGGMFQVRDGSVRVRSTILEPYAGEPLEQAVQTFPMLVAGGTQVYFNSRSDRPARRSVIATDREGRVLLLASASLFGVTLADLAAALASSDLGIVDALNLDGGGSAMLFSPLPRAPQVRAFDAVPAVIAAYPRDAS